MPCIHTEIEKYSLLSDKAIFTNRVCKYYIHDFSEDKTIIEQLEIINDSFHVWNQHLIKYDYRFEYTENYDEAFIKLYFVGGSNNKMPHDGYKDIMKDPNMIAFYAVGDGFMYINDHWDFNKEIDLKTAIIHEIGHALGIGHTIVQKDYMYLDYNPKAIFTSDTINAIRKLYAPKNLQYSILNLSLIELIGYAAFLFLTYKFLLSHVINQQ